MGKRAHVAGTLHIVLSTERIHAHPLATDVASQHGQIGNAHDHGRTLTMLGHAQAVVDGRIAARGVESRGAAHCCRIEPCDFCRALG